MRIFSLKNLEFLSKEKAIRNLFWHYPFYMKLEYKNYAIGKLSTFP